MLKKKIREVSVNCGLSSGRELNSEEGTLEERIEDYILLNLYLPSKMKFVCIFDCFSSFIDDMGLY